MLEELEREVEDFMPEDVMPEDVMPEDDMSNDTIRDVIQRQEKLASAFHDAMTIGQSYKGTNYQRQGFYQRVTDTANKVNICGFPHIVKDDSFASSWKVLDYKGHRPIQQQQKWRALTYMFQATRKGWEMSPPQL